MTGKLRTCLIELFLGRFHFIFKKASKLIWTVCYPKSLYNERCFYSVLILKCGMNYKISEKENIRLIWFYVSTEKM